MVKRVIRSSSVVGIVLLVSVLNGVGNPCFAAPAEEDAAPKAEKDAAPKADAGKDPGKAGTPGTAAEAATPVPTVDPKAAEKTCKETVAKLRSGDFAALEGLPENQRQAILAGSNAIDVLTCLAVAEDKESHCDPLEEEARKACKEQWKVGRELKGLSKEKVKGQLIYRTCASNSPGVNCDVFREVVGTGKADRCKDLKEASQQTFCAALATGDAKTCDVLKGGERGYCVAFATDDPSHCPKEATDCIAMARGFAALKKGGLEAFADIDARLAAASMGSKACDALLTDLESACSKKD